MTSREKSISFWAIGLYVVIWIYILVFGVLLRAP